ncbi:MAG: hypothetical protein AAGJ83_14435, partial [Planctomycetota bacterium]
MASKSDRDHFGGWIDRVWESIPVTGTHRFVRVLSFALALGTMALWSAPARADLFDALDAYPPRWKLDTSDCNARIIRHENDPVGGADGGGCEVLTLESGLGSRAMLLYPIEPTLPLDDLTARLSLMTAKRGIRIGLRLRYPHLRDSESGRPVTTYLYGAAYDRPARFQMLGIGSIENSVRVNIAKLRKEFGSDANLSDPYVDGVVINAYGGPGKTTLRLDSLRIDGMVPSGQTQRQSVARAGDSRTSGEAVARRSRLSDSADPFPSDDLVKILEYQGEPLRWVRSLGFDAVLLPGPPDAALLREAIQSEVFIYAPPPT